jgi:hypothetical protein
MASEADFDVFSADEHARNKGMWAGALKPIVNPNMRGLYAVTRKPTAEELEADPEAKARTVLEVREIARPHAPALCQGVREVATNASDFAKESLGKDGHVTRIDITFSKETGFVSVYNDGPGIPIAAHAKATEMAKRTMYVPEMVFSSFFSGSNLTKGVDNVKGGINGLGAKLANVGADEFNYSTLDAPRKRVMHQKFLDRMRVVHPAVIAATTDAAALAGLEPHQRVSHTKVWWRPAYKDMGYAVDATGAPKSADAADLEAWIWLLACQLAAYIGPRVAVAFNGQPCECTSSEKLARLYCSMFGADADRAVLTTGLLKSTEEPYKKHPWSVTAIVFPPKIRGGYSAKMHHTPIINGVLSVKGTHLDLVKRLASDAIAEKLAKLTKRKGPGAKTASAGAEKKISMTETLSAVRFVMCGALPGADWSGQSKDELQVPQDVIKSYAFTKVFLESVALAACDRILIESGAKKETVGVIKKYIKARYVGHPLGILLGAEGDSALQLLRLGLSLARGKGGKKAGRKTAPPVAPSAGQRTPGARIPGPRGATPAAAAASAPSATASTPSAAAPIAEATDDMFDMLIEMAENDEFVAPPLEPVAAPAPALVAAAPLEVFGRAAPPEATFDYYGAISLQGVIPNVARSVTTVTTSTGDAITVRSPTLQSNERLKGIQNAWGLQYSRKYATAAERATLNYPNGFVLATDQDLDGIGKIDPLVLVFFFQFWPELLRHRMVGRWMTPVIRAVPKRGTGAALSFLYESEFERWRQEDPTRAAEYVVKYYKGLASHDDDEAKELFAGSNFHDAFYWYTLDDAAKAMMEVYFGKNADLRKAELSQPQIVLGYNQAMDLHRSRLMPLTLHLQVDAGAYKRAAIRRQIPHAIDGLNPAKRKIIDGAIQRWRGAAGGKDVKVYQLGGYVADHKAYHNGDASLSLTIIHLSQAFPPHHLPYLIGVGQMGTRHATGDEPDHGSPRYVGVKPSPVINALFPHEDMPLLRRVVVDGEPAEPEHFVPVVPTVVLDSLSNPSEGWRHQSYARDYDKVLAVVRALLDGDAELTAAAEQLRVEGPTAKVLAAIAKLSATQWPLPPSARNFHGEFRMYKGETHSFGDYSYDQATRTISVTELPIGLATATFLANVSGPGTKVRPNQRLQFIEGDPNETNYSSGNRVQIHIRLAPGAYEKICEKHGDDVCDPIEDFLLLRATMKPFLNYYTERGSVTEYGSSNYLAPLLYWFPARRDLYRERFVREEILARLRIREQEEVLRYIPAAKQIDLANCGDEESATESLAVCEFARLDTKILHRSAATPTAALEELILRGPGADYNHILALPERELVAAAVARRTKKLAALRAAHAAVLEQLAEQPFPGVSTWRRDIAKFETVIARGVETDFKFKVKRAGGKEEDDDLLAGPAPEEEKED